MIKEKKKALDLDTDITYLKLLKFLHKSKPCNLNNSLYRFNGYAVKKNVSTENKTRVYLFPTIGFECRK